MSDSRNPVSKLDRLDRKILASLHRDGRITKSRMSEEVGLSATRCCERMQKLERSGVIRGYHADIDLRRLARLSLYQVQVSLTNPSSANAQQFERMVARIDEIISCQAVLGTVDYLMVVAAPDTETYHRIMEEVSSRETLAFDYITYPVTKTVKSVSSVSLLALIALADGESADA
jgi:Lrp/AsnC family transcriptional regulator of ectoine degradation